MDRGEFGEFVYPGGQLASYAIGPVRASEWTVGSCGDQRLVSSYSALDQAQRCWVSTGNVLS